MGAVKFRKGNFVQDGNFLRQVNCKTPRYKRIVPHPMQIGETLGGDTLIDL